jgi:hypothetical protein
LHAGDSLFEKNFLLAIAPLRQLALRLELKQFACVIVVDQFALSCHAFLLAFSPKKISFVFVVRFFGRHVKSSTCGCFVAAVAARWDQKRTSYISPKNKRGI